MNVASHCVYWHNSHFAVMSSASDIVYTATAKASIIKTRHGTVAETTTVIIIER